MLETYTLSNGIPVFVVENHGSPVVSIQAWVQRGSVHEPPPLAGISHFIEHALFKGTKKRKVGEIAKEIEAHGGEINAYTSYEETVYHTTMASRYFNEGLDVIADAITCPLFDPLEMDREREVILEEIKRAADSPGKVLATNLWRASFPGTPYGRPVLGFVETVSRFSAKTLKNYFKENYHSGTISLIVVGDIQIKHALKQITKKLSKIPHRKQKPIDLARFAKPKTTPGLQVLSEGKDIQECYVQIAIPAPHIAHPEIPALDLACSAIGQGESSRFYQTIVKEKHLALDVELGLVATGGCGLLTTGLIVAPKDLQEAIKECRELAFRALEEGIEEEELERVKSSLESETTFSKETVDGYARRLGYYYCHFGNPEHEKHYLDALMSVTREQAIEAFRKVMNQNAVASIVHPNNFKFEIPPIKESLRPKKQIKLVKSSDNNELEKYERPPVRYILKPIHSLPLVSLKLIFPGGSREESPSQLGIGNLFQRVWTSGTKNYTSLQIARTLESLGASIGSFCGKNTLGLSTSFLAKHWNSIRPILDEVLLEPTFPEEEIETERNILLREIASENDNPYQKCYLQLTKELFGDHPYGRSSMGTKETVEKLNKSDLQEFHRNFVHQRQLVVSSVGSFRKEDWLNELESLVRPIYKSGKEILKTQKPKAPDRIKTVLSQKHPLFQSHLLVGFVGASLQDPERHALKLMSSVLSGQGGRLFLELRDKQSLAYSVSPIASDGPETGIYAFYIGCSPEKIEQALVGIRKEIQNLLEKPISEKELKRAKQYWIGRFELDLQRFSSQAMMFGLDEVYGLGFDNYLDTLKTIKSISAKEIQKAAQNYLLPDKAIISIVHPTPLDPITIESAWGLKRPKGIPKKAVPASSPQKSHPKVAQA